MRRKFLSFFSYAVIACMSAFALTACGGDDNEPDAPDTPDTPTGEPTLVGTWIAYDHGLTIYKCTMTMKSDQSGTMAVYDADTDELKFKTDFRWIGFNNQLKLTFTEDGEEEIEKYNIKRLDSEILIIYNDEVGSLCYINNNAVVTPTKELMVGTWLECYEWDKTEKKWQYDEIKQNSDGTGIYNQTDITWSFSGNTYTQIFSVSKYDITILLACKNMLWCDDDGYCYVMLRK